MLKGSGIVPGKYILFQWLVLSELRQLTAKHGLGSPAVANILQYLTPEEVTHFDIKQLKKLIHIPQSNKWFLSPPGDAVQRRREL